MKFDNNIATQQPNDRLMNANRINNSNNNIAETQNDTQFRRLILSQSTEPNVDFADAQETPLQSNQKQLNNSNNANSGSKMNSNNNSNKNIDSTVVLETVGNIEVIITQSPDSSNQATTLHGKCYNSNESQVAGKIKQQRRDNNNSIDRENEPFLSQLTKQQKDSTNKHKSAESKIDRFNAKQLSDDNNETKVWI